jgi:hypothetical protein
MKIGAGEIANDPSRLHIDSRDIKGNVAVADGTSVYNKPFKVDYAIGIPKTRDRSQKYSAEESKSAVANTLMKHLNNRNGVAGIMGNIEKESAWNSGTSGDLHLDTPSFGLYQHRVGRLDNLKSFAESNKSPIHDPTIQTEFAMKEAKQTVIYKSSKPMYRDYNSRYGDLVNRYKGKTLYDALQDPEITKEEAAALWTGYFEIPNKMATEAKDRGQLALKYAYGGLLPKYSIGGKIDAKDALGRTYTKTKDGRYLNTDNNKLYSYDVISRQFIPIEEKGIIDKYITPVVDKALSTVGLNYGKTSNKPITIDLNSKVKASLNDNPVQGHTIMGGEFIEDEGNSIRTKKEWYKNKDGVFGDKEIPVKNIKTYYGVENDKLIIGGMDKFKDETVIIPVRSKDIPIHKTGFKTSGIFNETTILKLEDSLGRLIPHNIKQGGKAILYSETTGNKVFINADTPENSKKLIDDFIQKNPKTKYIMLDNGRFRNHLQNKEGLKPSDFFQYGTHTFGDNKTYNLVKYSKGGQLMKKDIFDIGGVISLATGISQGLGKATEQFIDPMNPNAALSGFAGALNNPLTAPLGFITGYMDARKKQNLFAQQNTATARNSYEAGKVNMAAYTGNFNQAGGFYAKGGEVNEPYEVEDKEVVQGHGVNIEGGKSQQLASDLHVIKGETHEEGGVEGTGGERVFSDRLKPSEPFKGVLKTLGFKADSDTYATLVTKLGKMKGKMEKKLEKTDHISRNTATSMLPKLDMLIEATFQDQEASKGEQEKMPAMFAFGGYLNQPKPKPKPKTTHLVTASQIDNNEQQYKIGQPYTIKGTNYVYTGQSFKPLDVDVNDPTYSELSKSSVSVSDVKPYTIPTVNKVKPEVYVKNEKGILDHAAESVGNFISSISDYMTSPKTTVQKPVVQAVKKVTKPVIDNRPVIKPVIAKSYAPPIAGTPPAIVETPKPKTFATVPAIQPIKNSKLTFTPSAIKMQALKPATLQAPEVATQDKDTASSLSSITPYALSALGYLNDTLANNKLQAPAAQERFTALPNTYVDRSAQQRYSNEAAVRSMLSQVPNDKAAQQAATATLLSSNNQVAAAENARRDAYNQELTAQNQAVNQANVQQNNAYRQSYVDFNNAKVANQQQAGTQMLGNINTGLKEEELRKLDLAKLGLILKAKSTGRAGLTATATEDLKSMFKSLGLSDREIAERMKGIPD